MADAGAPFPFWKQSQGQRCTGAVSYTHLVTSGVKLINLDEGVTVASIAKVREDTSIIDAEETEQEVSEDETKELTEEPEKNEEN